MLKTGDKLPAATLFEFIDVEAEGCSIGPNAFDVHKSTAGKTIAVFALPGAFTPTCSAYALQALEHHGAWRGTALAGWRVLRCHPWCNGGHDPVPAAPSSTVNGSPP